VDDAIFWCGAFDIGEFQDEDLEEGIRKGRIWRFGYFMKGITSSRLFDLHLGISKYTRDTTAN
jgi:hypothetical protein